MTNNTCCFTGHRTIPPECVPELEKKLLMEVIWLSSHGIDTFYAGGAQGFDLLAGRAVLTARDQGRKVRLIVAVPWREQDSSFSERYKAEYSRQLREADEVVCLSQYYFKGCTLARDRYMVDRSSICVCWLTKHSGGTAYTVTYAKSKGLRIINLADTPPDDNDLGRDYV